MGNFISESWDSISGQADVKDAIAQATKSKEEALRQALAALNKGSGQAMDFTKRGFNQMFDAIGGGYFDPAEFGQGMTAKGFGNQLSMFSDPRGPFADLINDRMLSAKQMLSSAGLSRSGNAAEEAARIPMDVAMGLSDKLFSRQSGMASNIANLIGDKFSSLSNIKLSQGVNKANAYTGLGNIEAEGAIANANVRDPFMDMLTGGVTSAGGAAMSQGIGALLGMLSDERLKTNIQEIGQAGPFRICSWDWIDEVKELDLPLMDYGVIAQEVEEIAPEFVFQIGELKAVNYDSLMGSELWQ